MKLFLCHFDQFSCRLCSKLSFITTCQYKQQISLQVAVYKKQVGNGDMWTPQSDSRATGFYIYDTEDSSTKYSASHPPFNEDTGLWT